MYGNQSTCTLLIVQEFSFFQKLRKVLDVQVAGILLSLHKQVFSPVFYFYLLDHKLVWTNPMLHADLYINYFVITLHMRKPSECDNSDVTST